MATPPGSALIVWAPTVKSKLVASPALRTAPGRNRAVPSAVVRSVATSAPPADTTTSAPATGSPDVPVTVTTIRPVGSKSRSEIPSEWIRLEVLEVAGEVGVVVDAAGAQRAHLGRRDVVGRRCGDLAARLTGRRGEVGRRLLSRTRRVHVAVGAAFAGGLGEPLRLAVEPTGTGLLGRRRPRTRFRRPGRRRPRRNTARRRIVGSCPARREGEAGENGEGRESVPHAPWTSPPRRRFPTSLDKDGRPIRRQDVLGCYGLRLPKVVAAQNGGTV